jgi:hypothetical protein
LLPGGIHRLDADLQQFSNLAGALALGHKLHHLSFPGGEPTVMGF